MELNLLVDNNEALRVGTYIILKYHISSKENHISKLIVREPHIMVLWDQTTDWRNSERNSG